MPATEFAGVVYPSVFKITVAGVNPASHGAVASVNTPVVAADVKVGDTVVAIPPATLEAGIAVQACHTVVDGGFQLRTTNGSAGAVDPASAAWDFLVYRR